MSPRCVSWEKARSASTVSCVPARPLVLENGAIDAALAQRVLAVLGTAQERSDANGASMG